MDIKVRDLRQTDVIDNENKLMVLVDDDLNLVKNITKEEFLTNVISSAENNALTQEQDGNLYVNTSEIADNLSALSDEVDTIETNIGSLADLTTQDKTNLVAAINEAASTGGGGGSLFDFKWSDHELDDMSWLRADTFSWHDGTVYSNAYNKLVEEIDGLTVETETIDGYIVNFYRAANGHKICLADQESAVLNIYNSTGIAWYYILDTTNTRFKLPRTKFGFEGLRTNVGDAIDEKLPNVIGDIGDIISGGGSASGAFYIKSSISPAYDGNKAGNHLVAGFNASLSSSTYQDNAPVQERATQMYLYFYVGGYTQTAIEQTAGLNAELFNGKADVDLSNVVDQAKILMSGMGMPSETYDSLTYVNTSTSYTAPANGWALVVGYSNNTLSTITLQNDTTSFLMRMNCHVNGWGGNACFVPCRKGDIFRVADNSNMTVTAFLFYYAQGSESEAS